MAWIKRKPTSITSDLESAICDACSELESLKDELEEWLGNLPDHLQSGSKGSELQEAIDTLSGINEPGIPMELAGISVAYVIDTNAKSRRLRRDNCLSMLEAAKATLEALEQSDGVDQLMGEIEEIIDLADSVEFPRMYG